MARFMERFHLVPLLTAAEPAVPLRPVGAWADDQPPAAGSDSVARPLPGGVGANPVGRTGADDPDVAPLPGGVVAAPSGRAAGAPYFTVPVSPPTILDPNDRPIDLPTALRLGNVQNPQLMISRQRVVESTAVRQLAAAQILPSLNLGTNYDTHTGVLQQSNGNILSVNRSGGSTPRRGGCGCGGGRHGRGPRHGPVGERGRGSLRLPDESSGGRPAAIRHHRVAEPDVSGRHASLFRTAPRRGPPRRGLAGPRRGEARRRPDRRVRRSRPGPRGRRTPGTDRVGEARDRRQGGRGGDPHVVGEAVLRAEPRPLAPAAPNRRLGRPRADRAGPGAGFRVDRLGTAEPARVGRAAGRHPRSAARPARVEGLAVLSDGARRPECRRLRRRE